MRQLPPTVLRLLALSIAFTGRSALADVLQREITAINADQTRTLLGTGKGVTIGIIDGGIDFTHPAVRGSISNSRDFTGNNTTADTAGAGFGHGTGVAGLIVGHDAVGGYTGIAPAAYILNARVVGSDGLSGDKQIGDGIFWAATHGAQVINLSLGQDGVSPITNKSNLMVDYAAERYGVFMVVAARNGNPDGTPVSAVRDSPGAQFDGLTVGPTSGKHLDIVANSASWSLPGDQRTKPDIVAPGENISLAAANWSTGSDYYTGAGTSFAAPLLGGVVAQMIGYGKQHSLSTSPLVLKSVLMTSALHVSFPDGTGWVPRQQTLDPVDGLTMNKPLDDSQGAGRIDALSAYQLYARKTGGTVKSVNWKESVLRQNATFTLAIGLLKAGQRIDTALTWLRHVTRTGGDTISGSDTYTQTAPLADFSLTLLRNGKRVATSDDKFNNVEYLSMLLSKDGDYSLQVYRYAGSGIKDESFALSERVLTVGTVSHAARALQNMVRKSSIISSMAMPETTLRSAEVPTDQLPEPSSLAFIACAAMLLKRGRRSNSPNNS